MCEMWRISIMINKAEIKDNRPENLGEAIDQLNECLTDEDLIQIASLEEDLSTVAKMGSKNVIVRPTSES
jgi:hypothetical protein